MSPSRPSRSCKMHALEARTPRSNKFLNSNSRGWNTSSQFTWDPDRPRRTYVTFLPSTNNTIGPLREGTLSPHVSPKTPRQEFSFRLRDVTGTVARLGERHAHLPHCRGKDHMLSQRCLNQAPTSSRPSAANSSPTRGMSTRYVVFTSNFFQVVNIHVEKSWF
jgi:hypothetical protein